MGQLQCKTVNKEEYKSLLAYKHKVYEAVQEHQIDIGNETFAAKMCKENGLRDINVAYTWISLYKTYMIYLGWQFEQAFISSANSEEKSNTTSNKTPNINNYLVLPYEILQVWKLHILYTQNYIQFCNKLTDNRIGLIDFVQPNIVWRNQDINVLLKNFRSNRKIVQVLSDYDKRTINSIFIFQSSYLKNIINYNILESLNTSNYIVHKLNNELISNNRRFIELFEVTSLQSLKTLTCEIEKVISECICKEECCVIEPPKKWELTEKIFSKLETIEKEMLEKTELNGNTITNPDKLKEWAVAIQNFEFPPNFAENFARHHLVTQSKANFFIDEYRKYQFLSKVTGTVQTPSEETDQVWHYHISFIKSYNEFSKKVMKVNFWHHNPSEGKKEDGKKYVNIYQETRDNLELYFGSCSPVAWPCTCIRFSKFYKWKAFHYFAKLSGIWDITIIENQKVKENFDVEAVGNGCVYGCGNEENDAQLSENDLTAY